MTKLKAGALPRMQNICRNKNCPAARRGLITHKKDVYATLYLQYHPKQP